MRNKNPWVLIVVLLVLTVFSFGLFLSGNNISDTQQNPTTVNDPFGGL